MKLVDPIGLSTNKGELIQSIWLEMPVDIAVSDMHLKNARQCWRLRYLAS